MSAAVAPFEAGIAAFALHALWQVPLLAAAAWCAVRVGRPQVRVAHALWVGTLLLCVALPLFSTVTGRQAAWRAERDAAAASISYDPAEYAGMLPTMQRDPVWLRLLRRHVSLRDGLQPFAFALPPWLSRVIAITYLLLAACFLLQLLLARRRVRLLVRRSSPGALPAGFQIALEQRCARLRLRELSLRVSGDIAGPALAGVFRPVLMLPGDAVDDMDGTEWEALLQHELAHLRRHDPVLHAACSLLLLPVAFHPAAWWVSRCIRQTREIACDAEAADRMGSRPAYARSLLRIAERSGLQQHGSFSRGFFSNGLFGAELELFNRSGAMEERMQMLVKSSPGETRSRHAVRVAACVSLGTIAVLAAGMLQVRPALAGERPGQQVAAPSEQAAPANLQVEDAGARLLSGDHAREQLRQARRELTKAEQQATSDEDRRRISTARGMAAAAESALARTGSSDRDLNPQVDLSGLQVRLPGLKVPDIDISTSHLTPEQEAHVQSPEWKAKLEKQRAYFNSPEWKANIERQQAYFNSPEWKARMQQQQQVMQALREKMNSPEWKAQIAAAGRVDTAQVEAMVRDARRQQAKAREQIRSGAVQRQSDQADQLIARNNFPAPPPVDDAADQPVKVSSGVMAGNVIHKEQPVYPPDAKEKKIQGAVLLHAIIGEEGKVEQLSIMSSPDETLSKSALDAVRQWLYKPFLLNGKPTAVETTITVNYSFSQ